MNPNPPSATEPQGSASAAYKTSSNPLPAMLVMILILLCDGAYGVNILQHYLARSFPTTTGRITQSKFIQTRGRRGMHYHLDIQYEYNVNGVAYHGDKYRYSLFFNRITRSTAEEIVAAFPLRSDTTVYYDPANPARALLKPGLFGDEATTALPIFVVNLIAAVLCHGFLRDSWQRWRRPLAGGVKILGPANGPLATTRIQLPKQSAGQVAWIAAGITALAAWLGLFLTQQHDRDLQFGLLAWAVVLIIGGFGWITQFLVIRSGKFDLILNPADQSVVLPRLFGRQVPLRLPLADLSAVEVRVFERVNTSSKGRRTTYYVFSPFLRFRAGGGGGESEAQLAEWRGHEKAEAFSQWLAQTLNVPKLPTRLQG